MAYKDNKSQSPRRKTSSFKRSDKKAVRRPARLERPERAPRVYNDEFSYEAMFDEASGPVIHDSSTQPLKGKAGARASDLVIGAHPLIELLKAKKRKVISIYTTNPTPKSWERVQPYLPARRPQIQYVTKEVLTRIAGTTDHMGIIAYVSPFQFRSKPFEAKDKPFILLLDSVQDVRNLGAILRSAHCMGVDGVVLCKGKSAPLTAAAYKASAGLAEHMEIYLASSLKSAVLDLKKAGYTMYMAVLENGKDALNVEYKKPMCLVIGNEASGITKEVRGMGELITLPQKSPDISYNASVAAALLMFVLSHGKKLK